ncbi:MAG: 2-C-methyl-D-erythritol 4-phosphate cytidylyltransferase [Clostridia bacterium]|nr:2-C-methyl-D-erythritol 4-phosphate cytidylyltransferase [Clostridia bacterium]
MMNYIAGAVLGKLEKNLYAHFNTAVIAAGGIGTRMRSDVPKQFIEIGGLPVIVRTVSVFQQCDFINEIIVVCGKNELQTVKALVKRYSLDKVRKIVSGGSTRQISVCNGIMNISGDSEFVAIHDAARCLIDEDTIRSVFKDAYKYGAATAASKVKDTVKISDGDGFIALTPDRETVWSVQTPQIFKKEIIISAHELAKREGFESTDDNALVERAGFRVRLTDCGYGNIKLTTPEDIAIAEALLRSKTEVNGK